MHVIRDGNGVTDVKRENARNSPPLKAMSQWRDSDLAAQAKASTRRYRKGAPRSLLDGVPIAIKDEIDVKGYYTTGNAMLYGAAKMNIQDSGDVAMCCSISGHHGV